MKVAIRNDKYQGRVLTVDGCGHPWRRGRQMYSHTRRKGWSRPIALAVALQVVCGSECARRYLVRRDWEPGKKGQPE